MPEELADLTDEMKASIGKSGPAGTLEVTTTGIRMFARAVGYTNPIYYDEEYAKSKGHRALPAPPGYHGTPIYDPSATLTAGPRQEYEMPFTRILNGGSEVEEIETIYAGDVLESVTTLADLQLRRGRVGQMLIRSSETVYTRKSDGAPVAKTRGTLISY